MAKSKASSVVSGATAILAAALPLESGAQTPNITLYGLWNATTENINNSPAFGVQEGTTGNTPVAQGDRRVRGNGYRVAAESRLGVRGGEDLGGGLSAIFGIEASSSDGSSTSNGTVLPGTTDRSRMFQLDGSSLGVGMTGLTSTVDTRVRYYTGRAYYRWPSSVLSESWDLWGRPSLNFTYDQNKIDYIANLSSPTFGAAVQSNTTVNLRDRYYFIGGGYLFHWRPGFRPGGIVPTGQVMPELSIDTNVALGRRDSYVRNAMQQNICLVSPCGAAENSSLALRDPSNGWTWSAGIRAEFRLNYKTAPTTMMYATLAGGLDHFGQKSGFNMPVSAASGPATFDLNSAQRTYVGGGVGITWEH